MELETDVLMTAEVVVAGAVLNVELARVRGRKYVVEVSGEDNREHYWHDNLDRAVSDFTEIIRLNADELRTVDRAGAF